jgi:hypothetical protein
MPQDSPIKPMLLALQSSTGWNSRLTDRIKDLAVMRLSRILEDDQLLPGEHIAAITAITRLQQVENSAMSIAAQLHQTHVLAERLDQLESALAPPDDDDEPPMVEY